MLLAVACKKDRNVARDTAVNFSWDIVSALYTQWYYSLEQQYWSGDWKDGEIGYGKTSHCSVCSERYVTGLRGPIGLDRKFSGIWKRYWNMKRTVPMSINESPGWNEKWENGSTGIDDDNRNWEESSIKKATVKAIKKKVRQARRW